MVVGFLQKSLDSNFWYHLKIIIIYTLYIIYFPMRAKSGFRLTNVCGSTILVAEGKENIDFSNIISMNESSKLLWESIQGKDFTDDDLAKILVDNYQIDENTPLPFEQALTDANNIVKQWKAAGIIL